jgi:hypothetical protein
MRIPSSVNVAIHGMEVDERPKPADTGLAKGVILRDVEKPQLFFQKRAVILRERTPERS